MKTCNQPRGNKLKTVLSIIPMILLYSGLALVFVSFYAPWLQTRYRHADFTRNTTNVVGTITLKELQNYPKQYDEISTQELKNVTVSWVQARDISNELCQLNKDQDDIVFALYRDGKGPGSHHIEQDEEQPDPEEQNLANDEQPGDTSDKENTDGSTIGIAPAPSPLDFYFPDFDTGPALAPGSDCSGIECHADLQGDVVQETIDDLGPLGCRMHPLAKAMIAGRQTFIAILVLSCVTVLLYLIYGLLCVRHCKECSDSKTTQRPLMTLLYSVIIVFCFIILGMCVAVVTTIGVVGIKGVDDASSLSKYVLVQADPLLTEEIAEQLTIDIRLKGSFEDSGPLYGMFLALFGGIAYALAAIGMILLTFLVRTQQKRDQKGKDVDESMQMTSV